MAPKVNNINTNQNLTTDKQRIVSGKTTYNIPIGGTKAQEEGYKDDLKLSSNLTASEQQKLDKIYNKVAKILKDEKIDINMAKSHQLLEKIACCTSKELIQMSESDIDKLVKILDDSLGWGDGLGFGKKDINDLDKLINNIHKKLGYKKTGGSRGGQIWHNIKKFCNKALGNKTIDECKNAEEISSYINEKYLKDIKNLPEDKQKEKYAELLKEFFYVFNSADKSRKIQMVKAVENLASEHKSLMIEVMETCLSQDPESLKLFGKEIQKQYDNIVKSKDAMGKAVAKEDAAAISHTAYKHMSKEDVQKALAELKQNSKEFLAKYGQKIEELKARRDNGEKLTEDEISLLTEYENVYVSQYAGAATGSYENKNIPSKEEKTEIIAKIIDDTNELGIQEEVLETVAETVENKPEILSTKSKEEFTQMMDKATEKAYSDAVEVVKAKSENQNSDAKNTVAKIKTSEIDVKSTTTTATTSKAVTEKTTSSVNIVDYGFATKGEPVDLNAPLVLSSQLYSNSSVEPELTEAETETTKTPQKESTTKNFVTAVKGGLEVFKEYEKNCNTGDIQLTVESLSLSNLSNDTKQYLLNKVKTWNDNVIAKACNSIKNNENKMEAGKLINSLSALKNVDCNNARVEEFFEKKIEDLQDLQA